MKILIAPLNWGLGHASRCVPLVQQFIDEGHEVIIGGDGESLTLLRKHFPNLRYVYLAPLKLRYGKGKRQVWAMVKAMPQILSWAMKDHALLQAVLREEKFDMVLSDNRFGLYPSKKSKEANPNLRSVYMTHQMHIFLPRGWRWLEGVAERLHARVCAKYKEVWIPDYEEKEQSLSGELGHPKISNFRFQISNLKYIGPQSRFEPYRDVRNGNEMVTEMSSRRTELYETVALLSGLEPQRTILEREIAARYAGKEEAVLIVQGLMNRPNTRMKRGNITIVPYLGDEELARVLHGARHIIARSGYSTIMDLEALGELKKAELIPTPGQSEQEYLAFWTQKRIIK